MMEIVTAGTLEGFVVHWLPPEPPLCYVADPFGMWMDRRLHVFVEAYDYRTRHGEIHALVLDERFTVLDRRPVLREAWHLSYPFVFAADGEIWMLPEATQSGRLSLYRAVAFPWRWERDPRFQFPVGAIDPTPIRVDDEWWLFYTPPGATPRLRQSVLKVARASHLFGPWRELDAPPVLTGLEGSRMGGTPMRQDGGSWLLPMQDCRVTYGAGVVMRRVEAASGPRHVVACGPRFQPAPSQQPYTDGLHTLSAAGPVTLVDTKRIVRSFRHAGVKTARWLQRL